MFCPRCGAPNPEDAAYCGNCGVALVSPAPAPITLPAAAGSSDDRSPLMASVLNALFGLGYVYLGYRKVLGLPAPLFVALMVVVYFLAGILTDGLLCVILSVVFAIDGHQKASGLKGYVSAETGPGEARDTQIH